MVELGNPITSVVHDHDVRRFDQGVDAKDIVQDGLDATACIAHDYGFCARH